MRMTLIATLITFLLCVTICTFSLFIIHGAVEEMTTRCETAEAAYDAGDIERASEILRDAGVYWDNTRKIADMVMSHTLLIKVSEAEAEALACITGDHAFEFQRAMAVLRNALMDVRESESPSITNIF